MTPLTCLTQQFRRINLRGCPIVRFNSSYQKSRHSDDSNHEDGDVKEKILRASLQFVPEMGWSKEALTAGAKTVGYPGVTHGLFQSGGADLVHHFQITSNKQLVDYLKQLQSSDSSKAMSPPEVVERACKKRLQMIIPYLSKWPQAIAIMSLPPNVPNALATLLTMVDDIGYYAGDRSVDINWYLRRIGIAGVYKSTELYLIQDNSKDYEESWEFLRRRLRDAVQLYDFISKSDVSSQGAKEATVSAFVTARNILGLNWNR